MEQWKEIEGYEGLYWISNQGRVKNKNNLIIKSQISNTGYDRVGLFKNGKYGHFSIHRLVALAFIPNSDPEKTQVNHKDENKLNNIVSNLEWCTAKYNTNYGTRTERASKKIKCIELDIIFKSVREAAKQLNLNENSIANAANPNQYWVNSCGHYHWQYIE